jgi:hypothetical protein
LVRGYFLQFSGLNQRIEQKDLPVALNFKKGQRLGNRQQAPQSRHFPVRFLATGKTEVKVLLIFASQVFLFTLSIKSIINGYN